jgi:hypothetical protein
MFSALPLPDKIRQGSDVRKVAQPDSCSAANGTEPQSPALLNRSAITPY